MLFVLIDWFIAIVTESTKNFDAEVRPSPPAQVMNHEGSEKIDRQISP